MKYLGWLIDTFLAILGLFLLAILLQELKEVLLLKCVIDFQFDLKILFCSFTFSQPFLRSINGSSFEF